jgi:hypothetical protein
VVQDGGYYIQGGGSVGELVNTDNSNIVTEVCLNMVNVPDGNGEYLAVGEACVWKGKGIYLSSKLPLHHDSLA